MNAVQGTALTKSYGGSRALNGLDVEVAAGTVHGLLGPNGAGKSTFLRALLGLVHLDGGELVVNGTVGGFVESPGAYRYLTGRQNLELLAGLDDQPGDVNQVLAQVDLLDRADGKVAEYSLGMRQRLGIAAGLLRRPDLLVLDEPALGLDPIGARALQQLIRGLAGDGLTVLLCSHDLSEVDAVCDDVTVIVAGARAWSGTVASARSRPGRCLLTTSDDSRALQQAPPEFAAVLGASGLQLAAGTEQLDRYVLALAAAGIAVRSLARESLPLEQAFLELVR